MNLINILLNVIKLGVTFFFFLVFLKEIELMGKLCYLFSTQDGTVVSLTVNAIFDLRSYWYCSSK